MMSRKRLPKRMGGTVQVKQIEENQSRICRNDEMIRRNDQIENIIETKTRGKVVATMIGNGDENLIGTRNIARVT